MAVIKKFSDRISDLVTIINPIAYVIFKDNPIIIMLMPIFVFIIRQIEEYQTTSSVRNYKELFPNMTSITVKNSSTCWNSTSLCYTHVAWYTSKYIKVDKCEAIAHTGYGIIHYEIHDDVMGSLEYKNETIYIHYEVKSEYSREERRITMYTKSNNLDLLKEFVIMCGKEYFKVYNGEKQAEDTKYKMMHYSKGAWTASNINVPKTKKNIFLAKDHLNIFNMIGKFLKSERAYIDHGIPYKKGLLMHGLPGTGKSSINYALAHEFDLNIYRLDYKCFTSDVSFVHAINSIPERSLVVIEDIDTYKFTNTRSSGVTQLQNPLSDSLEILNNINATLSDVINDPKTPSVSSNTIQMESVLHALDGYTCLHGCIIVFTTNHIEHIDPALLRAGRIDHHYEFTYADADQIRNVLKHFDQEDLVDKYIKDDKPIQITTAMLIQHVLGSFIDKLDKSDAPDPVENNTVGSITANTTIG